MTKDPVYSRWAHLARPLSAPLAEMASHRITRQRYQKARRRARKARRGFQGMPLVKLDREHLVAPGGAIYHLTWDAVLYPLF